jgi:hypothetical protein
VNAQSLIELQNRIIVTTAQAISGDWDAAVVNIEIDEIEGEQTESCLALSFALQQGTWKRNSFELPFDCYDLFVTLRDSSDGEKWKTCTVEFDYNGKYKLSYTYEAPRRLNGIHDDEAMLKGYIPVSFS